jgi:hypothetical protein
MTAAAINSKILLRIKKHQRHMNQCSSLEWSVKKAKRREEEREREPTVDELLVG